MVFMHIPTWSVVDSPLELVLSVATIGAQYCFEHRNAERLFRAAKALLFERLHQKVDHFGYKTAALLNMQASISPRSVSGDTRVLRCAWEPIDTVRTLINVMAYATWEMDQSILQQAFGLQELLVQVVRDLGLEEDEEDLVSEEEEEPLQSRWLKWARRESVRRAKLIAFSFTHTHSIAYNVYPPLRTNEVRLRLPCHTEEWKAPTATAWQAVRGGIKQQLLYQEGLSLLLRDSDSMLDPVPTPIGNYLLLHGLLQRIYIVRDLSQPAMDHTSSLPPDELNRLE